MAHATADKISANESAVSPTEQAEVAKQLAETGAYFHGRGWSVGTSSNYSVVLDRDPLRLFITASGKDKGRLGPEDFVIVDDQGHRVEDAVTNSRLSYPEPGRGATPDSRLSPAKPSAETLLHVVLARQPDVGSVLHTHSIWGTLLSDWYREDGAVTLEGYEMLKGLDGIRTHEHTLEVPIFDNTQDIPALAVDVERRLLDAERPLRYGFLISRHGLYTWGRDLADARRHVEVFEFLFEVVGRTAERRRQLAP